jgi:hypothetical protein
MVHVENNSAKHFRVLYTPRPNQRDKIALMHSERCKIVSGIKSRSVDGRAHPDVYKPFDALDEDELDDSSADALDTATKKGDEKLNQEIGKDEKPKKDKKESNGKTERGDADGKPPKLGDERKNEDNFARHA